MACSLHSVITNEHLAFYRERTAETHRYHIPFWHIVCKSHLYQAGMTLAGGQKIIKFVCASTPNITVTFLVVKMNGENIVH